MADGKKTIAMLVGLVALALVGVGVYFIIAANDKSKTPDQTKKDREMGIIMTSVGGVLLVGGLILGGGHRKLYAAMPRSGVSGGGRYSMSYLSRYV